MVIYQRTYSKMLESAFFQKTIMACTGQKYLILKNLEDWLQKVSNAQNPQDINLTWSPKLLQSRNTNTSIASSGFGDEAECFFKSYILEINSKQQQQKTEEKKKILVDMHQVI